MKYGILGLSRRAKHMSGHLADNDAELICAYDDNEEYLKSQSEKVTCELTSDLELFWKHKYDFVFIGSSNNTHIEHIVRSMKENVNIFCEKPIITKIEDYQKILETKKETNFNKLFATGFVLRFSPIFKKLKEVTSQIGKIGTVSATDVIKHTHGAHFFNGWRRFKEDSGGYCVEKICHSLDILNWCIGSHPTNVFAFGGNNFWIPENAHMEKKFLERDPKFYQNYQDYDNLNSFTSDKTICDNITASLTYANGTNLNLTMLNYAPNARRTMMFYGVEGSVEFIWEMSRATIKLIPNTGVGCKTISHKPCETQMYEFGPLGQHGGGDAEIAKDLAHAVKHGRDMSPSIQEAFQSNNACIAVTQSLTSKKMEKVVL